MYYPYTMSEKKNIVEKEREQLAREMLADKYTTTLKKFQFINELKNGLGDVIKTNPKVKVLKKSWFQKIKIIFKTIFTKF